MIQSSYGSGTPGVYSSTGQASGGGNTRKFGRVVDVILDSFHPEYDQYGKSQSINGVFYRQLDKGNTEDDEQELFFAFCGTSDFKKIPLKGEVVKIETLPSDDLTNTPSATKDYWTKVVTIWNHPHHNAYPDTTQQEEVDFGDDFNEEDKIAPLQAFPGDYIIEGRHAQSIRFSGTKYESNELVDDSNNGKPYTIISNGQKEPENSIDPVIENINEDPSSLYFTSDHTVPLTQANEKRDAWEEEPEKADVYKGSQILGNADRIYLNGREEGIYLSAKKNIGLNSEYVGIDGEKYVGIDAKKIYLGTTAFEEKEPALKGQTSTDWLDDLVGLLEGLANTLATTPPTPPTYIAGLVKEGVKLKAQLPQLKGLLKQLHSKKVYIDNK